MARYLNIEETIPDRKSIGEDRAQEVVGTGDGSETLFYTNRAYIIASTYSFTHGATQTSATALVEETDYTLDKDNGTFTLISVAEVGTGNIYGVYSFAQLEITNTQLQDSLDRAQEQVDKDTGIHFADGTEESPDYTSIVEEKHDGQGSFDRAYYLVKFPLPKLVTSISSDIAASATAVPVSDTTGFPTSGYLLIDANKIQYTDKGDDNVFLNCSGIADAHVSGATVVPNVVEVSTTSSGTKPSWQILNLDSEFDIDYVSGRVHLYSFDSSISQYSTNNPPNLTPNRCRITYLYGYDTIPADIKRVTLMLAVKDLMHTAVRKALISGQNIERIEDYLIDNEWIKDTTDKYKSIDMANT